MNLNLACNSVGFYQLSKLMCIPFTIAVQRLVFRQEASRAVKLTLVPILLGVGLATVHDVSVNLVGTVFAIVAVVFTTFSQIFTQRYQAALECNALQLLYLTSPLICFGMVLLAPFFDNVRDFQAKYMPPRLGGLGPDTLPVRMLERDDDEAVASATAAGAAEAAGGGLAVWIFLSCVLALGVNISNYLVLGKTSPLTYQVLGT
jgi:solute carrier family 35, member E3